MERPKITARKSLGAPGTVPEPWHLSSLADLGEERFSRAMLDASEGDPFDVSTPESALDDLQELVEAAGGTFDASSWYVASDEDGVIGVVLPQPYEGRPDVGTLFYLGVVPSRRGEGLGRRLHALGLHLLAVRGVRRYVGSTDATNASMITIFERNGCVLSRE